MTWGLRVCCAVSSSVGECCTVPALTWVCVALYQPQDERVLCCSSITMSVLCSSSLKMSVRCAVPASIWACVALFQHQHECEAGVPGGSGGHSGLRQVLSHLCLSGRDEEAEGTHQCQGKWLHLLLLLCATHFHSITFVQFLALWLVTKTIVSVTFSSSYSYDCILLCIQLTDATTQLTIF